MSNDQAIIASFRLTTRDYFRVFFSINLRKTWYLITVVPICIGFAVTSSSGLATGLLAAGAVVGLVALVLPYQGARTAARNRNLEDVVQYKFSHSGVDVDGKYSSGHLDWTLITRVIETGSYVVIFVSQNIIHLIPKVALSGEDLVSLRNLLRESISGSVRLNT
jgi:hypothetical protein